MNIDQIIKSRKTQKVLASEIWEPSTNKNEVNNTIHDLLDLVAFAPYYKKCHSFYSDDSKELNSCVPWRFYVLDTEKCRKLIHFIDENELKTGKIKSLLSSADALFMVTWLPNLSGVDPSDYPRENQSEEPFPFVGNKENMDHIASTSAAIQNVLIGATARDIPNYWSSGGKLREVEIRNHLGIPMNEILLGAIFLFPKDSEDRTSNIKTGQFREQGKDKNNWSKWIK